MAFLNSINTKAKALLNSGFGTNPSSYGGRFLNKDGTLNYKAMIETLDEIIRSGETNPLRRLDRHYHKGRNFTESLKERFELALQVRDHMRKKMCGFADNIEGDFDDNESY